MSIAASSASRSTPSESSSIGVINGGWWRILHSPSTISASFEKACRLSCARALAMAFQTPGVRSWSRLERNCGSSASMSRCAYQTSSIDIPANSRIVSL